MTALSEPKNETQEPVATSITPPPPAEELKNDMTVEIIRPDPLVDAKKMEGWEMLHMVLQWIRKEHSADEKALARQLANSEISYRFLWLYYTPGKMITFEDPIAKQQMAARVVTLYVVADY